jgi:DNA invertase Pin-like site-specific DNA recombinase
MLIGYARVSTVEQDNELQLRALKKAGVRKVFSEKRSAVKVRAQLLQMLEQLRPGDVVVVYKLDRLARSLRDLLGIVDRIAAAGASFRSLTESIDTSTPSGELVFHILGSLGQFERSLIRERSIAGMEVAKANGVRLGRLPALDNRQAERLATRWSTGKYSKAELAAMFGVSVSTVKRTLWRKDLDTISEKHAHGMLPPH